MLAVTTITAVVEGPLPAVPPGVRPNTSAPLATLPPCGATARRLPEPIDRGPGPVSVPDPVSTGEFTDAGPTTGVGPVSRTFSDDSPNVPGAGPGAPPRVTMPPNGTNIPTVEDVLSMTSELIVSPGSGPAGAAAIRTFSVAPFAPVYGAYSVVSDSGRSRGGAKEPGTTVRKLVPTSVPLDPPTA